MKKQRYVWIALLVALCFAGHQACAQEAGERVVTLDRGQILATLSGVPQAVRPLALPLHWDSLYSRQSGRAHIEIRFPRPTGSESSINLYALFILRLGNGYTISLNGVLLASLGDLSAHYQARSSKQPLRITFPATLLKQDNLLTIELRGDYARGAGLSKILFGPAEEVEKHYRRHYIHRVVIAMAGAVVSALVSAFCLLLWLQHRDRLYAWASIGQALWAIAILDTVWLILPISWLAWALLALVLRAIWIWSLYAVVERIFGPPPGIERRAMLLGTLSGPVALLAAGALQSRVPFQLWLFIMSVLFVGMLVRLAAGFIRHRTSEQLLLWFAVFVMMVVGVHDGMAERSPGAGYAYAEWAKYAGTLLAISIMWIVSNRFHKAQREASDLQATLAARVEAKEHELHDTYARLSQVERSRAVTAERERILRDMHDGVGTSLATAMRQLEGGAASSEVAASLRESLDHLKLSIDAMTLPTGDVNALLAGLRYRLQPRFEGAGLALEWDVDLLPIWPGGTDQAMRHLQFLLLEGISNALQHSRAVKLTLCARHTANFVEILLRDNGRGIGEQRGRGMQSMRDRADAIGATLEIETLTPGTCIRVTLPIA